MTSFTQKEIELDIVLSKGSFGGNGNTKIIRGLACQCDIEKVSLPDKNKAKVQVFGLSMPDMEQLTTLAFLPLESQKNYIQIKAGEKDKDLALVFSGEITKAYANFNSVPDVSFELEAMTGYFPSLMAIPATTVQGEVKINDLLEKLSKEAGYSFTNKGISGSCVNPYLVGSVFEQMKKLAQENDFELIFDDSEIIALPADQARGKNTVKLSKDTGLIGYPTFSNEGIKANCIYEKALQIGGLIEIESMVPKASGIWKITKLTHSISANFPSNNVWESSFDAVFYKEAK